MRTLYALLVTTLFWVGCKQYSYKDDSLFQNEIKEGITVLLQNRNPDTGMWKGAGWWNAANILTCLIRYAEVTNDSSLYPIIEDVYLDAKVVYEKEGDRTTKVISTDFINDYYDDEAWWALAWIDAYKLTKEKKYLTMAVSIFRDMTTGWDEQFEGGTYWKKNPFAYKNAVANNLFALTAARLYKITRKQSYLTWFSKEIAWFEKSGMINSETYYIEDGLEKEGSPNHGNYYTYNQGVALAAFAEMYTVTKKEHYLIIAHRIAKATIDKGVFTTDNGILRERNKEIAAGNDGAQFKGVFLRHLAFLHRISPRNVYKDFILRNAKAIIKLNYDSSTKSFGCYWFGPFYKLNIAAHSSAMECLIESFALFQ